jgi:hypothetical protein
MKFKHSKEEEGISFLIPIVTLLKLITNIYIYIYIYTYIYICVTAIGKVTSGDLLTKQALRKKMALCTKNRYIFKLLLTAVTAGIDLYLHYPYFFMVWCLIN